MANERLINNFIGNRQEISNNSWRASIFGGTATLLDNGIYLLSNNGTSNFPYIRINRDGIYMKDTDIELLRGSLYISGGQVAIYSAPNGLTSNTYMLLDNTGLSAFQNNNTTFYVDAYTGNVFVQGTLSSASGYIGSWKIYPSGLSSDVGSNFMWLSPENGINYNNVFLVDSSGSLTANNAFLKGTVCADAGYIANWSIYDCGLSAGYSEMYNLPLSSFTGTLDSITAPFNYFINISPCDGIVFNDTFIVDPLGNVFANSANIKGSISADSGYLNNLYVYGTLTGGSYWYDSSHYINLNGSLSAINFGDKFVVLSSGDVFLSNLSATGDIYASYLFTNNADIGGWHVDTNSIHKKDIIATSPSITSNVYLSSQEGSASANGYPSGRVKGLQVFNDTETGYYYDLSIGKGLIETNNICGLQPLSGTFEDSNIPRNLERIGMQFTISDQGVAHTVFELSSLSGFADLDWPYTKLQIAGMKFGPYGLSSCNNDFVISSNPTNPGISFGSTTSHFIHLGVSGGGPYFSMGSTANTINFAGDLITLNVQNIVSNSATFNNYVYINSSLTTGRVYIKDMSLTAPQVGHELTTKYYVDNLVNAAITATISGFSGIGGNGTVNYIPVFTNTTTLADSVLRQGVDDFVNPFIYIENNYSVSGHRFYVDGDGILPVSNNELASKWYVDQFSNPGYWSATSNNIYLSSTSYFASVGFSGVTGALTSYKFGVSGSQYISDRLNVGFYSSPTSSLTSYTFAVSGTTFLDGITTSDRILLKDTSLTAPLSGSELVCKDYVDFKVSNTAPALTGTPDYIPKYTASGTALEDSIMYQEPNTIVVNGGFKAVTYIETDGAKYFNIVHPSFNSQKYRLKHSSTETNKHEVYYRGKGEIINGVGIINLPYYFKDLCSDEDISVHLTSIKQQMNLYVDTINYAKNRIYIKCDILTGEFFWIVYGIRKDIPKLIEEIIK